MGVTTLSLLPFSGHGLVLPIGRQAPAPFYKVIYDERFKDCVAFAEEVRRLGLTVEGIQGDVTDLWCHDLYYQWRERPAMIAGLTQESAAFNLAVLARDANLFQLFRGEHFVNVDNQLVHRIKAPLPMIRQAEALPVAGKDWAVGMAHLICGFDRRNNGSGEWSTGTVVRPDKIRPTELVSWVLSPLPA